MKRKIFVITTLIICINVEIVMASNVMDNRIDGEVKYNILDTIIPGFFTLAGVLVGFIGLYINNKLEYTKNKKEQIRNILMDKYNELITLLNRMSDRKMDIHFFAYNRIVMEYYANPNKKECIKSIKTGYNYLVKAEYLFYDIETYIENNNFLIQKIIKYENYEILYNMFENERNNDFFRLIKLSLQCNRTFTEEEIVNAEKTYTYYLDKTQKLIIELKQKIEQIIFC